MCLFNVLKSLSGELDLKLYPVHVNQKIRPGEAEADQAFVERLCPGERVGLLFSGV